MEKKEYITPAMEAYKVVKEDFICVSPPPYSGPLGAKNRDFDDFTEPNNDDSDNNDW